MVHTVRFRRHEVYITDQKKLHSIGMFHHQKSEHHFDVNIYSIPFIFSTTLLLYKLDTLLLKHSGEKRNPLYPIRAASFVSIVLYLILSNMASYN
jgi:hypothetical protein